MPISFTPISTIQFTSVPGILPIVEAGHCDPVENCAVQCGSCLWVDAANLPIPGATAYDCCGIGYSKKTLVPKDVPIKQLLSGTSIAPWVRLRFVEGVDDGASSEITTGNISQPGNSEVCRAVIKSFQYGWGTIASGNICKITISDELGTSFNNWVNRIVKNPETASQPDSVDFSAGVYKMRVQWGWTVVGADDSCPAGDSNSTILSSPQCWFLPNTITVNMQQNGKFVYEIEGVDLMIRANEHGSERIIGTDLNPKHFTVAARELADKSLPGFNIDFLQLNEDTDTEEPLEFWVEPGVGRANPTPGGPTPVVGPSRADVAKFGPVQVWPCQANKPLGSLQNWIKSNVVKADTKTPGTRGKGLTFNYDSTSPVNTSVENAVRPKYGKVIIWADAMPTGNIRDVNVQKRLKALYVVNGGKCSPVFSFTPQMKWNFTAAVRSGGVMGTSTGTMYSNAFQLVRNAVPARGPVTTPTQGQSRALLPTSGTVESAALQRRTNVLHHSIEAELKVQGDPSDWLCTPLKGYGRCVALVVINPFSLDKLPGAECPTWSTVNTSVVNQILTNRAWFIRGVDHQIKEGSYTTTLKVILFAPGGDSSATDDDTYGNITVNPIGVIDPLGYLPCPISNPGSRATGTTRCNISDPAGDIVQKEAVGEFCFDVCGV